MQSISTSISFGFSNNLYRTKRIIILSRSKDYYSFTITSSSSSSSFSFRLTGLSRYRGQGKPNFITPFSWRPSSSPFIIGRQRRTTHPFSAFQSLPLSLSLSHTYTRPLPSTRSLILARSRENRSFPFLPNRLSSISFTGYDFP